MNEHDLDSLVRKVRAEHDAILETRERRSSLVTARGKTIRKLRERGMRLEQIGDLLGVSYQAVQQMTDREMKQ